MFNKINYFFLFLVLPIVGFSQDCLLELSGIVEDLDSDAPLEIVNIYIEETGGGTITDSTGYFQLNNLCAGSYHLVFSHIGCESQRTFVVLNQDTTLQIKMDHSINLLEGVTITEKTATSTTQNSQAINGQRIADNANQNLSTLLTSISGVSTLKNGSGIAKPVIHGLYGNRLTILNNGIAQSGQQWGNDHSPEIDPLVANKIRVIKGVSALAYNGSNLGGVVLVEPQKIGNEEHLHGKGSYFFESNGLSHGANVQVQQYTPFVAWKINGTFKKSGDKKTADYFLNNSGNQEANLALQLEKKYSEQLFTNLYFSSFNTELGVLRGSHIGNLTDLESAFERDIPFFTEDEFSYQIDAPKQRVGHQLLKLQSKYFFHANQFLEITVAGQLNNRKEFDVRRSGRSDIPALDLKQFTVFGEGKYENTFANDLKLTTGIQLNVIDNTNTPGTGILPLVPDYLAYETGLFAVFTKKVRRSLFEIAARYDNVIRNVATITNSTPRKIARFENNYHNFSTSGGWNYQFNSQLQLSFNTGLAMRNPAVNELYSNGLHQGVSGIEEGTVDLKSEQSLKSTLSLSGAVHDKFSFETLVYYQQINDYIYLRPEEKIRLTIRGAFPVFKYQQTDARIYGVDISGQLQLATPLSAKVTYSYIKGDDLDNHLPLINIPANNLTASLKFEFPQPLQIGQRQLENFELELENRYVFQQTHLLPQQDFVATPAAYNLLHFKVATDVQFGHTRLRLFAKVDNILNIAYRDYLNRQRYFADELGRNVATGVSLRF